MSNTISDPGKDEKIFRWLKEDPSSKKFNWEQPIIKGISKTNNPLMTETVKSFSEKEEYKNNPIVKLFSRKCLSIQFNSNSFKPPTLLGSNPIIFKSSYGSSKPENNREDFHSYPATSLFAGEQDVFKSYNYQKPSNLELKEVQFFIANLVKFETSFDFVEPILCSGFLFSEKQLLSENWNFAPEQSLKFFENQEKPLSLNHKVLFSYRTVKKMTYLVIFLKRVFQGKTEKNCNRYYRKNSSSNLAKVNESFKHSWPDLSNTYNVFAWTFAPISELMSSPDGYTFPRPTEFSEISSIEDFDSLLNSSKSPKGKTFPIDITIKVSVKSIIDISTYINDGYKVLQSLITPPIEPLLRFQHNLIFVITGAHFVLPPEIQVKNVYIQISYHKSANGEKLPLIYRPYFNDYSIVGYTKLLKHIKNPIFGETFYIKLPSTIEKGDHIALEYYTINQGKDTKTNVLIATSIIPFYDKEGNFLKNGKFASNITYDNQEQPNERINFDNKIIGNFQFISSIIFNDNLLTDFYSKVNNDNEYDLELLDLIDPNIIIQNLLQIIDLLIRKMNSTSNKIKEIIQTLEKITSKIINIFPNFEQFLLGYALDFAKFSPKKNVHKKILKYWKEEIDELNNDNITGTERYDLYLSDFLFLLIIKSLLISKDKNIENDFVDFINSWCKAVIPLTQSGLIQAKKANKSFTVFLNLLSDIGFYTLTIYGISIYLKSFGDSPNDHKITIDFLENVLQPKLFVSFLFHSKLMVEIITDLIKRAKNSKDSIPFQRIFDVLLRICSFFESDGLLSQKVSSCLVDSLTSLIPLNEMPFIDNNEIHSSLIFFDYIISHIDSKSFMKWWQKSNHNEFYDSLHFLLDKTRISLLTQEDHQTDKLKNIEDLYSSFKRNTNELTNRSYIAKHRNESLFQVDTNNLKSQNIKKENIVFATHFSFINILHILILIDQKSNHNLNKFYNPIYKELSNFSQITKVLFHLLVVNTPIDFISPLIDLMNEIASAKIDLMFVQCCPILPKFILTVLKLCKIEPKCNSFFNTLFEADMKKFKNNNRSNAVFARAFSYLKPNEFNILNYVKSKPLKTKVKKLKNILEQLQNNQLKSTDPEYYSELLYNKSLVLEDSPDARVMCLDELAKYHQENEYFEEEIQTLLLQASIICEYLTKFGKLKGEIYETQNNAALLFVDICSSAKTAMCPTIVEKDLPHINSYCDSPMFSNVSFVCLLEKIITRCNETQLFETGIAIIDHLWLLLENYRAFGILKATFMKSSEILNSLSKITDEKERLFGHYFKVSFFGKIFGGNSTYVYREKKLTHLYEFSSRIFTKYKNKFGEDVIELIKESKEVDQSKLDPEKGYIQITFVEPFLRKNEQKLRLTQFEQSHNLTKFSFDAPFVKGGDKSQGSVEEQWLRKTIIEVDYAMPFVLKSQKVDPKKIKIIDFEPMRVAYRQLRERVTQMSNAIERSDVRQIQQLLHGSLLVQVNEGPLKIAEVFIGDKKKNDQKYTKKLKSAFANFLEQNEKGLKIHAQWVNDSHVEFIPLQHELESGFASFEENIRKYLK